MLNKIYSPPLDFVNKIYGPPLDCLIKSMAHHCRRGPPNMTSHALPHENLLPTTGLLKHETAQTQPGCWWRAAFELMPAKPVVAVQFAETVIPRTPTVPRPPKTLKTVIPRTPTVPRPPKTLKTIIPSSVTVTVSEQPNWESRLCRQTTVRCL